MRVRQTACSTCIYKTASPEWLAQLEDAIKDEHGHMIKYRACHHHDNGTCCRGFWNKHRHNCTPTQIAERIGYVRFSDAGDRGPI